MTNVIIRLPALETGNEHWTLWSLRPLVHLY